MEAMQDERLTDADPDIRDTDQIIKKAEQDGFVDVMQLSALIGALNLDAEQIDQLYEALENLDIEFIEYDKAVRKRKKYSADQILELIKRYQSGDHSIYEELILANTGLVVLRAARYRGRGLDMDEMVQEGIFGVMRAVEKFNPALGYTFSSYAGPAINRAIQKAIAYQGKSISVPDFVYARQRDLAIAEVQLQLEFGRQPTLEEMAERAGLKLHHAKEAWEAPNASVSLNKKAGDGEDELGSFISDENVEEVDKNVILEQRVNALHQAIAKLTTNQQQVLEMRFGLKGKKPKTLDQCGKTLGGLSKERVRQIEEAALKQLRKDVDLKKALGFYEEPSASVEEVEEPGAEIVPASSENLEEAVKSLTVEEIEILEMHQRGLKESRIAEELGLGAQDVRKMRQAVIARFAIAQADLDERILEILKAAGERD